ncbi:unspecific monooxygenase [Necator americanus]|uniref:Unspecific monooxygenase n=1 Tax=Necator americanus TaxID=51031 RepID=W2THE9_NECAM|nr:unspecific monooxygenase [Necator americanus]ETN80611.1 unspecific monooxygenase [Necator americanus]
MPTVHIADFDIAQDAMVKHGANYSDRWVPMLFDVPRSLSLNCTLAFFATDKKPSHLDGLGLIASNGKVWLDHRRFSLHTFRNFGFGRNIIEERIMEEFNLKFDAIDRQIQESGNNIVDAVPLFEVLVGSIINRLLFSERFDSSSDHFFAMKRKVDEIVSRVSFLDLFVHKFMLYLPILRKRYGQLLEPMFDLKDYLRRQLEQRKSDIKQGKHLLEEEGRDYVDAYLIKMAEEKAINEKETLFTEEALLVNLLDLWIAGQETTTTTIVSGLINLINYPEVVDKVRAEIKVVTGDNRPLSLQDRSSTPYLLATITFDPTRYMNGGRLDQHVVPFGIGKRSCLGESLAKAELYLIIGNLIQRYALSSAGSLPSRDEKSPFGLLRRPKPFKFALSKIT